MSWKTFWLEPTGRDRLGLRRYSNPGSRLDDVAWTCEQGWHDALRWTGEERDTVIDANGCYMSDWDEPPHDDPGWPAECVRGCGYQFVDTDRWQTWGEQLYQRTDTGELRVLHWAQCPPDAPSAEPGATWDVKWLPRKGPDGISLMVRCPRGDGSPGTNHDWPVDMAASSGGYWTRTGEAREALVTAAPSIAIGLPGHPGFYHGFLQAGVLTDHLGY